MIRIIMRGIAAILLEVATTAVIIAVALLALSAYLTARFVGVNTKLSRRTSIAMKLARDLMALGAQQKKQEPDASDE